MKNWKRLLALLLCGVMALSLFACNTGDSDASPSVYLDATAGDPSDGADPSIDPDPDASAIPGITADLSQDALTFAAGLSAGDILLTINGEDVPADLFLYMLDMSCAQVQPYLPLLGTSLEALAPDLLEDAVTLMISHVLLRQKAAQLGCPPTDAQNEEIDANMAETDLETIAAYYGLTTESVRFIYGTNSYYDNVLAAATHEPSEQDLVDYAIEQGDYRVKHILLKTVDDNRQPLPEEEVAQKKAQAEDLLAQLQAASDLPALFDQLMNELSEDGRDENGDLYAPNGYLATPGQMVSEFEEASQALKDGELSGIVESSHGYHIILRLPLTPFTDEEKAVYEENYRPGVLNNLLAQWQEESEIIRSDALDSLDVAGFYNRLTAYQQARAEQEQAEAGDSGDGGAN